MTIQPAPLATLRAQLAGDTREHKRLLGQLAGRDDRVAYSALVHVAFLDAVDRRFGSRVASHTEIVDYVADVRSRLGEKAGVVDPQAGEQLILEVLGRGTTDGLDSQISSRAMFFLLTALVTDECLDGPALDRLISRARETAECMLETPNEPPRTPSR